MLWDDVSFTCEHGSGVCTLMFVKLVLLKRLHRHVKVVKRNLCFFGAWQLKASFTNVISLLPS